ncbi:MAG: beta strand repeat-containing protein, partial [Methylobacter sp.]
MTMLAFFSNAAQAAAPAYQAQGAASSGTGSLAPVWPTHQTDDIALLIVETANQAVTLSSNTAGFVEVASSPQGTGTAASTAATRLTVFWTRATSNAMASPTVADSGDHQIAQIVTFRGVYATGNPWDVTVGDVLATAGTGFSIPGATTTVTNSLVVAIVSAGVDANSTTQRSGWTNASLTGLTERVDSNTNSGNGGGFGAATGVKATAGTYNSTTGTLASAFAQGRISIALKPKTTTLGDGTNPSNVTLAPSAAITDLDAFTLQASSGTDSVTALTVTLTGTNSFQALSEVRITSSDGATTYFSAVANPASNTIAFSGGTPLPVTSTATAFKVRITPKTHANMPVPPGLSYSVGGTVTAFTNTNEQLGSDGASAAVTVDNLSPASATTTSGSAGIAKNTLNWTSSAATDFNTTSGSIVYRWAAASAGSEVPAEGSTPTLGGANGTATVACVVSSAVSTALVRIDGTGGSSDCTTTALTDGQAYTYKVFQKDNNGNYDVGVTIGTFTPSSITLGDGTNPANTTLAPSAAITDLDAFTLQTSSGTDSVTALTVTLTGTNSFQALSEVRITSSDSATTYFSAVANPASNTISFSGGTPIPATSTATTFKVRITPKTHANMPAPPGLSYSVGGTVTAFTSTKVQLGSDGTSAAVTVDNLSPASATTTSGSAGLAKNTLNWTSSADTDFNTTSGSIVYRWAAASAGSEVPTEGSTPTVGGANGTATVACVVSSAASTALVRIDGTGGSSDCTTTALTNGQAYTYKVFQKDSNGNYDVGVTVGTFTPTSITLGDGTNPANATLAPSAAITDLDAFTLQTSNGTDSVTALTVTLTGTNSFQALSEARITSSDGVTTYFLAVANPASNTISFSGGTPIPVTSTATTFKVRITPKTHANMPVPPGLSYSVGGTVTAFTSTKLQTGSDGASASLTVDNLSPASATVASGSSDDAKVALNWTTSVATDFNTTSGSIVYRWAAASAGSEVPVEGSTPTLGGSNGTATVACVVSSAASTALARIDGTGGSSDCTTTALTNGQAYTYKVFQKDSNGNYDVGMTIGTITPAVVNCTSLATGNWSATSTWTQCRSGIPLAGDTVTIASGHTVTVNTTAPATGSLGSLTINSGGTLTASVANTLTLGGNLTNNGTLSLGTFGNVTLTTASQWTGTGATWTLNTLTLGSQALSFNATDTFTLAINGSISGLGTINSGATNTGITLDFRSASTQTVPTTGVTYPNLTVSGGSTKTPASGTLDIRGNFTVAASTTFAGNTNNPAVTVKGNFSNSGTFNAGAGVWTLSGTSAQSIAGTPSFGSLTINNASGVSLSSNVTVSTVLALTNGTVTTGANTLIASGGDCTISISRSNGYVIGNLQLTVPATNPVTCSYPVGDSIGYAPISITKSGTNTGTLIGRVDSGDHPDGSSTVGINQAKNANHYWTLTAGTLSAATPYTATFQFCATGTCVVPTELDTGANTSNFVVAKKSGSWSNQTVGTKTTTSTQANGLTGFGVFEVGEQGSLNCTSLATGNWNTAATWTNCHGGVPLAGDTVTIVNTHTVTLDTTA